MRRSFNRGGNYNNDGTNCRSSNRGGNNATNNASTYANANNGFRLSSICECGAGATRDANPTESTETPEQEETCTNPIPNTRSPATVGTNRHVPPSEPVGALRAQRFDGRIDETIGTAGPVSAAKVAAKVLCLVLSCAAWLCCEGSSWINLIST